MPYKEFSSRVENVAPLQSPTSTLINYVQILTAADAILRTLLLKGLLGTKQL